MIILRVILIFILLTSGFSYALDEPEIIPIKPITQHSKEIVVFSFYDTQLDLVCYSANSGIFCIPKSKLSTHAQEFIKSKISIYSQDLGTGIKRIPRIVPLEK